MTDVTMRQLLELGVHFGHQTRFWSPKMSPYIYGHRNKIHIINLERTLAMFNEAMNYLGGVASKRGTIMFVGTKRQAGMIVREQAQRANCPYVYHRWLGGMLTNHRTVKKSIDRLNELNDIIKSDGLLKLAKKEALRIEREQFRLDRNLAGIQSMRGLPDALFVIDVKHENIAVKEANKLGIPVVAVVDTNCDPDGIDYVIPGNDDAISAIRLYCTQAADSVLEGRATASTVDPFFDSEDSGSMVSAEDLSMLKITGARAAVAPSVETTDPEQSDESPVSEPQSVSAEMKTESESTDSMEASGSNEPESSETSEQEQETVAAAAETTEPSSDADTSENVETVENVATAEEVESDAQVDDAGEPESIEQNDEKVDEPDETAKKED